MCDFCSTFDTASGPGIHILGLPFGKLSHNIGKSPFLMGKSTINGQCQKQTVSLPEANSPKVMPLSPALHGPSWESCELSPRRGFVDGLEFGATKNNSIQLVTSILTALATAS
jgi:hypothetical protein